MLFPRSLTRMTVMVPLFVLACLLITSINIFQLKQLQEEAKLSQAEPGERSRAHLTYSVFAKHPDSGYLKHVFNVLERGGYSRVNYNLSADWDVMWAHDYPFRRIRDKMLALKPGQKVNKYPGSGYITNKVQLATSGLDNVPPAFSIPDEKEKLLKYAATNPEKMFVQKSNNHRGIKIEKIEKLDLSSEGSFVQEFVHNPLLVDGFKFDVGLYTTLTSVDPLRIYVHNDDILLRFCPEKYHPFDPENKDKYVVHDDYLPSWKVPSLAKFMDNNVGFSFKDSLNAFIKKDLGKDPEEMWQKMYDTIIQVYKSQEEHFVKAVSHYPHKDAFFEMVRFDFVIDDSLSVYLMEANMSPNLSSAHFAANALLYEQVVHSVLRLVGVVGNSLAGGDRARATTRERDQQASMKDLLVTPLACSSQQCQSGTSEVCGLAECELCKQCLTEDDLSNLKRAWLERANQWATIRLFPRPVRRHMAGEKEEGLTPNNRKMGAWFRAKCDMDRSWCDA